MNSYELSILEQDWLAAKADETEAQQRRRDIEDRISAVLLSDATPTQTVHLSRVSITRRQQRKVDYDTMLECAHEHGLEDEVPQIFRFEAKINEKVWKKLTPEIISAFAPAVTTSQGRPSFTTKKDKK